MKAKTFTIISFFVIAVIGILLRTYKIQSPIADWHSWRQVDTAAVARNYVQTGIDLLRPKYDDLSNIQTGVDNPEGYRMVEFPLYQGFAAWCTKTLGKFSVEVWLRILAIIASSITGIALGIFMWRRINAMTGVFTALLYAILPYSIYYGRAILPDGIAVSFAVLSVLCFDVGNDAKTRKSLWMLTITSGIFAALAILVKPVAGFMLLPIAGALGMGRKRIGDNMARGIVLGCIALLSFYFWRHWIANFPEGIPAYTWLFNGNNIRFKGAWFNWLFAERIGKLILGYWGLIFLGGGLIAESKDKERWASHLFGIGALLYMAIVATGNVQHDYYQIIILPAIVVYAAKGLNWIAKLIWEGKGIRKAYVFGIGLAVFVGTLSFSWYTIRTYYWINRPEIIEAGNAAKQLLPVGAKVIAPYNGDTTFLYQTGHSGWPIGFDIDKKIQMGAGYYVTVSPTDTDLETKDLAAKYTVLVRNDKFAIIDLTRKK